MNIDKKFNVFIIVCAAATRSEKKNVFNSEIFKKLLKYKNVFFKEKIKVLFVFKQKNYVIEVEDDKKPSYEFLYNLSQTKLSKLR